MQQPLPCLDTYLNLLTFLEGSANGFCTASCAAGTNRNLLRGAISVTIMVNAVLYVAADTVDMALRTAFLA